MDFCRLEANPQYDDYLHSIDLYEDEARETGPAGRVVFSSGDSQRMHFQYSGYYKMNGYRLKVKIQDDEKKTYTFRVDYEHQRGTYVLGDGKKWDAMIYKERLVFAVDPHCGLLDNYQNDKYLLLIPGQTKASLDAYTFPNIYYFGERVSKRYEQFTEEEKNSIVPEVKPTGYLSD